MLNVWSLACAVWLCVYGFAAAAESSSCDANEAIALSQFLENNAKQVEEIRITRGLSRLPTLSNNIAQLERYVFEYLSKPVRRRPDHAVIFYSLDSDQLCVFLWKLSAKKKALVRKYVRTSYQKGRLEQLTELLSRQLNVQSTWNTRAHRKAATRAPEPVVRPSSGALPSVVAELSSLFFPSAIRDYLKGTTSLSLISVRSMSSVPVSMLEPFGDGRKAVDLFSIQFLSLLAELRDGVRTWPRPLSRVLIVGNPRPSADTEWSWDPLPGAEHEAKEVHRALGGDVLLDRAATRGAVLNRIANYDYVHFAAHGYSDKDDGLDRSYIVLGDGRLTAREVQVLPLKRKPIVVLSACQTGEGLIVEGGVIGIARAFQEAGASNTVMSLWAVNDLATFHLMTTFVAQLSAHTPAEALRLAMLSTRERYPGAEDWAAFNIFGPRSAE